MRLSSAIAALAACGLVSFTLASCSGEASQETETPAGAISANATKPVDGLLPVAASDPETGKLVKLVYGQLVDVADDGTVANELAESIETKDSREYTITLKPGLAFSNGDPIDAPSFVNAWNYAASKTEVAATSVYFAPIEGYAEVVRAGAGKTQAPAPDATAPVTPQAAADDAQVTPLAGLRAVDERTISVRLTSPESDFPTRLASPVFSPLPVSAFGDLRAFGKEPASSGPYQIATGGASAKGLMLVPNPQFAGERKAANAGIDFRYFGSLVDAYSAFEEGRLDVIDQLPAAQLAGFGKELGERAVNEPIADLRSITIPGRLEHFAGAEGKLRRQALSLAIDRSAIVSGVLHGTATAASDFTSPVVLGWSNDLPGADLLQFDAERAKQLWAQADQIAPWSGQFTIAFNTDGSHAEWVAAVLASIHDTLGIEVSAQTFATLADLQAAVQARTISVPYRSSWRADHPSAYNFLAPVYSTAAAEAGGFNDGDYSSKAFDKALDKAAGAPTLAESVPALQQAEKQLLQDLPSIPLWDQNTVAAHSARVANLTLGWDGVPQYTRLTVGAS